MRCHLVLISIYLVGLVGLLLLASQLEAQTLTTLYSFKGAPDGESPYGGVILDPQGNLYGTTETGGDLNCPGSPTPGCGTVFKLTPGGVETVLYSFAGGTDGFSPQAGLVMDSNGNLYGTTLYGGNSGYGTIFEISARGPESVLHSFAGGTDGAYPYASLILDSKGNLYGTAQQGGAITECALLGGTGCGLIFKVTSAGQESVFFTFPSKSHGAYPVAPVILDSKGRLYGTTYYGGKESASDITGQGTVFRIGTTGLEKLLCRFELKNCNGAYPSAGLIFDKLGNLYGTTEGLNPRGGTVFMISPSGTVTTLYNFCPNYPCSDGYDPQDSLVLDAQANLYGTAHGGINGGGVVFKLTPNGTETVLYSFCAQANCADGEFPKGPLVFDAQGNLYGTTIGGGAYSSGTVFELSP